MRSIVLGLGLLLCVSCEVHSQEINQQIARPSAFPKNFFAKTNAKLSKLNAEIEKRSAGYLKSFLKEEEKLKAEFFKLDSNAATSLFLCDPERQYSDFLAKLDSDSATDEKLTGPYLPYADSLQGVLLFMKQNAGPAAKLNPEQINYTLLRVQKLHSKLNQQELIRQFVVQRKEQIRQYLSVQRYIPPSLQTIYKNYNEKLYYFSGQLSEYRQMLNDPSRLMTAALALLNKLPAFSSFMKQNSFLAGLFNVSEDYNMSASVAGMQTRGMVNQLIQNQIASGTAQAGSAFNEGLQTARSKLDQLKDKLSRFGQGGDDADLPAGFRPNSQKTKTFFDRLEYGVNFQTLKNNSFFPATSDIGLSLGYKANDKTIVGVGMSYKVGWGKPISHVKITSQGVGLRSFLDQRIKPSLYVSGGFEYNYQQAFASWNNLRNFNGWQQSGLIGLSKIFPAKGKFFKKAKLQVLWDFLSYQQPIRTQPIKFRIGFSK